MPFRATWAAKNGVKGLRRCDHPSLTRTLSQ
jgi:hypothetical protein